MLEPNDVLSCLSCSFGFRCEVSIKLMSIILCSAYHKTARFYPQWMLLPLLFLFCQQNPVPHSQNAPCVTCKNSYSYFFVFMLMLSHFLVHQQPIMVPNRISHSKPPRYKYHGQACEWLVRDFFNVNPSAPYSTASIVSTPAPTPAPAISQTISQQSRAFPS